MPTRWQDLIFEERISLILGIFPSLSEEEKRQAVDEWANMEFEYEHPVWKDEVEYTVDGKLSALTSLQGICERMTREKAGLTHPSRR